MKVEELRKGNWLQDFYKEEPYRVTLDSIRGLEACIEHKMFQPTPWSGIPLTEEWLLRMGFVVIGGNYESRTFGNAESLILDKDGDHFNVFYRQANTDDTLENILMHIELKYVHQAQNLIYTLTGEELKIEDSIIQSGN